MLNYVEKFLPGFTPAVVGQSKFDVINNYMANVVSHVYKTDLVKQKINMVWIMQQHPSIRDVYVASQFLTGAIGAYVKPTETARIADIASFIGASPSDVIASIAKYKPTVISTVKAVASKPFNWLWVLLAAGGFYFFVKRRRS